MTPAAKIILGAGVFGLAALGFVSSDEPDVSNRVDDIFEEARAAREAEFLLKETEPLSVPVPARQNCHPSYSGCLDPYASDYDCAGGSGNGPRYTGRVQVVGHDEFDLDRDGNGWGCDTENKNPYENWDR